MTGQIRSSILLATALLCAPPATAAPAPVSAISQEPFYAAIVSRARRLERETGRFAGHARPALLQDRAFTDYAAAITALSADDLKGHLDLKARRTDSDLKCILMGVSLDLKTKLDAIEAARTDDGMTVAFGDMSHLLSDNIDVIVTPASVESGLDCVIEFGDR